MINRLLLPDTISLRLHAISLDPQSITLYCHIAHPFGRCPDCHHKSIQVHSRYERTVADLPCAHRSVFLKLTVRRFFCLNSRCKRLTFTEQIPHVLAPYARKTSRLIERLRDIGLAEGGEQGARTLAKQAISTSADTVIRLILDNFLEEPPPPRVLGIDDWAWRKGQSYGTILVDLERHEAVDLLPDRKATTLSGWLKCHQGVEIISRDRAGAYAEGAANGAPHAIQVADRFHLYNNIREALEHFLDRRQKCLKAVSEKLNGTVSTPIPDQEAAQPENDKKDTPDKVNPSFLTKREEHRQARREQRKLRYEQVLRMHGRGKGIRAIARELQLSRGTVRRYLRADEFPEHVTRLPRKSILDPYKQYMAQRMAEGCLNGLQLWREIQERGYSGSRSLVSGWVATQREDYPVQSGEREKKHRGRPPRGTSAPKRPYRLSARRASWLLIRDEAKLNTKEKRIVKLLIQSDAEIAQARSLVLQFITMLRKHKSDGFDDWITAMEDSNLKDLVSFARGVRRGEEAVRNALRYEWSNGQVEGQVNRLKMVKRQMYGRAKFDLLRARILAA